MMHMLLAIGVLGVGTYVLKALGPLTTAGRALPPTVARITKVLPAALLAALAATQTVGDGAALTLDARIVGVGVALVAVLLRAPLPVVVLVGAAGAALTRALGWG